MTFQESVVFKSTRLDSTRLGELPSRANRFRPTTLLLVSALLKKSEPVNGKQEAKENTWQKKKSRTDKIPNPR